MRISTLGKWRLVWILLALLVLLLMGARQAYAAGAPVVVSLF